MVRDAKRQVDGCAANASTGPNRRIRTVRELRALFVFAGGLPGCCDALVVGRERALIVPFAIIAIKPGRLSRVCVAARKCGKEFPELVECAHI
jgi:hypothetical protein